MEIKILFIKPGEKPEVMEVEDKLESYQKLVGGYIEMVYLTDDVALICNEEGKIMGLKNNRNFNLPHFKDCVVGNIVIVGVDDDSGEFVSLNAAQIERFTNAFSNKLWINEI